MILELILFFVVVVFMYFVGYYQGYRDCFNWWRQERNYCKCGKLGDDAHGCPYKEEINDDYDSKCNCCAGCAQECAWDI